MSEALPPPVPDFPPGNAWFNIDRPLRFSEELRGRVVVLDFWTYSCVNCLHVVPELEYLETKYAGDPVTFIGVHSPKYPNEADPENLRDAILRHGIAHPVVADNAHEIWNSFGINAWPTLVVIDATGRAVATLPGEGHREELDQLIAALLEVGRDHGTLVLDPLHAVPEPPHQSRGGLLFPGKIIADRPGNRLFIADSGHHRVIITDWGGEVLGYFGSGIRGFVNGAYEDARFNNPQGLALFDNALYIADTGNHAIRRADLSSYHVDTILGNGAIGYDRRGGHRGTAQTMNSPWDLVFFQGMLYIAMAGLHQIWAYDPETGVAEARVGTGREAIADQVARRAALAQPSGLAADATQLYFADAETSAIRRFDPGVDTIATLVGQGLFTFGDRDGDAGQALLQHPLGVAVSGKMLYVADTFNHKIRGINLATGKVSTIAGVGRRGRSQANMPAFAEPGGLAVAGNDLFVADTNNDRLMHCRLNTGAWKELPLTIDGQPLAKAA